MLASSRRNQARATGDRPGPDPGRAGTDGGDRVTFATFSGQSRISARNFAQSVNQPQRDELMDYALSQLISDTADIRSAIRGHSLARDMYGNDAQHQRLPGPRPDGAVHASVQRPVLLHHHRDAGDRLPTLFDLTTNIPVERLQRSTATTSRGGRSGSRTRPAPASLLSLLARAGRSDPRGPGRQRLHRDRRLLGCSGSTSTRPTRRQRS